MEIGSFLEYKKEYFNAKNDTFIGCVFFESGREALRYMIGYFQVRTLYLPSYFCDDVSQYLEKIKGLTIKEYVVDELFRVKKNVLTVIENGNKGQAAFLLVDFFGRRDPNHDLISKLLKKKGIIIFLDRTHSILNDYKDSANPEFASIRKLLVNLPGSCVKQLEYKGNYKKINIKSNLAFLKIKDKYLKNHNTNLKSKFLKGMMNEDARLAEFRPNLEAIKSLRLDEVLCGADFEKMKIIRQKNYNTLHKHLNFNEKFAWLELGFKKNEAPAFALIKCCNYRVREKFKAYLIKNSIYPPMHWPNRTKLSKLLLSIPIDHRYSQKDMLFVASVINNFKLIKL